MKRSSNSHTTLISVLRTVIFLAHDEPAICLNRSLSYPSNLQRQSSQISLSGLTSSTLPSFTSNLSRMESDDSTNSVFETISQFNNSNSKTQNPAPPSFHSLPAILSKPPLPKGNSQCPPLTQMQPQPTSP